MPFNAFDCGHSSEVSEIGHHICIRHILARLCFGIQSITQCLGVWHVTSSLGVWHVTSSDPHFQQKTATVSKASKALAAALITASAVDALATATQAQCCLIRPVMAHTAWQTCVVL